MLKTHKNNLITGITQKLTYVFVVLSFTVLSACSSTPSSQDDQPEQAGATAQQVAPQKGPYETDVMNQPSVVSYVAPEDPLRFINEPIFSFNDTAYTYVFSPLAAGYKKIMPEAVAEAISNFFYNLREPLYALNHLLQGNFNESWESVKRVVVNSTVGLAGLFDAADGLMEIERNKTTFGNTLQSYGVGHGAYLVLPLLGPSDFRDTGSLAFNYFAHPLNFINDESAAQHLLIIDAAQSQVPVLSNYPKVLGDVENKYEFVRNLYMQNLQRDGNAKRQEAFTPKNTEE
jgi:phospholipid-binding lipoprotein MlaA